MHLEVELDGLFEMYPNSFHEKCRDLLRKLSKYEFIIDYNNLPSSGKLYKVNFSKEYGTLYSLLKNLPFKKLTFKNATDVKINFINDLLNGFNEPDLDEKTLADLKMDKFANTSLSIANCIF